MNSANKFGAWLLTERGRNFLNVVAGVGTAGIALIKILPNTFFINNYRDVVHYYKDGFTVPLTKPVKQRFDKVLDILEIPEEERLYIQPFFSVGFDVFSAGTTLSNDGSIIGLPITFSFIDSNNVDTSVIKIKQESVPWEVDDGKLLYKSLFIPEKAQMYAMAREIEMSRSYKFVFDTGVLVFSCLTAYNISHLLNKKFNLYAKQRSIRFVMYGLICTFMSMNYFLLKDALQTYYEAKIDKDLKNKNEVFVEGGKEYYEKMLTRNIALRGLLGKEGKSLYSPLGNENYLIRQKHLPIVQRKDFFDSSSSSQVA